MKRRVPNSGNIDQIFERIVSRGWLNRMELGDLYERYVREGETVGFVEYLVRTGVLGRSQLDELLAKEVLSQALTESEGRQTSTAADGLVGEEFSGCRIVSKLGKGGMGTVYKARRTEDGREVVVKFLAPELVRKRGWLARFDREARVMEKLDHPSIVRWLAADAQHEQPHIVMEYVAGKSLDEVLEDTERYEEIEAARLLRALAEGLGEVHRSGIVHRDLKPGNLVMSPEGRLVLIDFGLARDEEVEDGLSLPGQVLGTPQYMAPEQWGDHRVDGRCDLFALGATLFHMLTGVGPFAGCDRSQIAVRTATGEYPSPRALAPDLSESVTIIIHRLLEPERELRYQTAEDVMHALDDLLGGHEVPAPTLMPEEDGAARLPLVPGKVFTVGREADNSLLVVDKSVSRHHAEIKRERTGFVLRDQQSSYGTFVEDMRIREVVLKDGDRVRFGRRGFVFRDGGMSFVRASGRYRRFDPEHFRVRIVPPSILQALVESGDNRAVMHLIEELAEDTSPRRRARLVASAKSLYGPEIAGRIDETLTGMQQRRLKLLPSQLFTVTHENLGENLGSWLSFWHEHRGGYPVQIGARREPTRRALIERSATTEIRHPLSEEPQLRLGRDPGCDVTLQSSSVSRHHASLITLHRRCMICDEGSRFKTRRNGEPVSLSFIEPGDVLTLGQVELIFEQVADGDRATTVGETFGVEPELFFALEQLEHPGVALALTRFLDLPGISRWFEAEARKLFEGEEEQARFVRRLEAIYRRRTRKARELLPKLLGKAPAEISGWRTRVEEQSAELPTQISPAGWFPPDDGSALVG